MAVKNEKKDLKDILEEKGVRKWFRKDNLIILVLSGVLLMVVAMPVKQDSRHASDEGGSQALETKMGLSLGEDGGVAGGFLAGSDTDVAGASTSSGMEGIGAGEALGEMEQYASNMERKLKDMLEHMEGVGEVEVMVTFQSSKELVLEKERPVTRSNTNENDAEGGSRTVYEVESGDATVYASDGTVQVPYVVKTISPKVEGVVVVAQGAGTARVSKEVTEAVCALFDLEAHKVKVIRAKEEEEPSPAT